MRVLMLCLLLSGCGQTCEEQGGVVVQHGFYYIWQVIDASKGTGFMQEYPNYVCQKEKTNE